MNVTARDPSRSKNKAIASVLLAAAMTGTMIMSWFASPATILDLLARSLPMIAMFVFLIVVTLAGANVPSRVAATVFFISFGILYLVALSLPDWGIAHLLAGLAFACDLVMSAFGCKTPMEANANDNFLVVAAVSAAGFLVGYFFEWVNEVALHWWTLAPSFTYPMLEIGNINLMIMFTYVFIGFFLFELALVAFTATTRMTKGSEKTCLIP